MISKFSRNFQPRIFLTTIMKPRPPDAIVSLSKLWPLGERNNQNEGFLELELNIVYTIFFEIV